MNILKLKTVSMTRRQAEWHYATLLSLSSTSPSFCSDCRLGQFQLQTGNVVAVLFTGQVTLLSPNQ